MDGIGVIGHSRRTGHLQGCSSAIIVASFAATSALVPIRDDSVSSEHMV